MEYTPQPLALERKIYYLAISIMLNTIGNALTVSMNMGSAMWTAASVNVANYTTISLGMIMFFNAMLGIVVNMLIQRKVDVGLIIGNFAFVIPFSYMVGSFVGIFNAIGLPQLPLVLKIVLNVVGILCVSIAISIYQRVNWVIHPLDELFNTVRFKYCKGSAVVAQWVMFSVPICVMIVMWIVTRHLDAVGVGTIVSLAFQGAWIGWADKHIYPDLPHYFR